MKKINLTDARIEIWQKTIKTKNYNVDLLRKIRYT
jgi:hypothetical protein